MKNMKTRIAAAAFAAITAVCGMQAMSASAYENYFVHTVNSQDYCEDAYNMGQAIKGWSRFGDINANSTWTGNATCGPICKKNFLKGSYSGNGNGTVLTKSQGLSMYMAQSFFGTTVFMEHITTSSTVYKPGDQVRLGSTRNASQKTIFITYVSGNTFDTYSINHSTNKIECCKYRKIANSYKFQRLNANGTVAEDNIYTDFFIRPIKQGDVNGDGVFTTADKTRLEGQIGNQPSAYPKNANSILNPNSYATELYIRAAFGDKQSWTIPYSAYYTIGYNLNHKGGVSGAVNNTGRMTWDGSSSFYYVTVNDL